MVYYNLNLKFTKAQKPTEEQIDSLINYIKDWIVECKPQEEKIFYNLQILTQIIGISL